MFNLALHATQLSRLLNPWRLDAIAAHFDLLIILWGGIGFKDSDLTLPQSNQVSPSNLLLTVLLIITFQLFVCWIIIRQLTKMDLLLPSQVS